MTTLTLDEIKAAITTLMLEFPYRELDLANVGHIFKRKHTMSLLLALKIANCRLMPRALLEQMGAKFKPGSDNIILEGKPGQSVSQLAPAAPAGVVGRVE